MAAVWIARVCSVKDPDGVVVQYPTIDEEISLPLNCGKEQGNTHGDADSIPDGHMRIPISGVIVSPPEVETGPGENQFLSELLEHFLKSDIRMPRLFLQEFPVPTVEFLAGVKAKFRHQTLHITKDAEVVILEFVEILCLEFSQDVIRRVAGGKEAGGDGPSRAPG